MGLNDTAEQLEAAQAQSVIDEATIAELRHELDRRDYRITALEYALTRAESALADRLQHDAHAHPTAHTIDREMVAQVFEDVLTVARGDASRIVMDEAVQRIALLVQPVDGAVLTSEEAALAVRAARHSAESIRAVLEVDPARLHPDVVPYVDRLTDLADHLQKHA